MVEKERKIITEIICVPTVSNAGNAFTVLDEISNMLGKFYCKKSDDAALLKYNGLISNEHKEELEKIAEYYNFALMYIETYEDDERLSNNTINLIGNKD